MITRVSTIPRWGWMLLLLLPLARAGAVSLPDSTAGQATPPPTTCDYTTASITLGSAGGSGNGTVRYVLADSVGTILQVSTTPTFGGLRGSHTYMALAISHDGTATNLTAGQSISAVTAGCYNWSDALVTKVCVPPTTACDYAVGDVITLRTSGGNQTTGTQTRYLLVDASGLITLVNATPSFATARLAGGLYSAYAVVYNDDQSLTNLAAGQPLAIVRANCLVLSASVPINICPICQPQCVPITVRVIYRR